MKTKYFLIIIILILFHSLCYTQDYWESIYNSEINIREIAINSLGNLFIGTQNGIFRSVDNGNSWENVGLENISVYSIIINSNDDIFAGTGGFNNIYHSIDNGENWIPQYSNPNAGNTITLNINSYGTIFAGSGSEYAISRSIDNGENWDLILSLSSCEQVNSIVENSDGVLFAGTTNFIGGGSIYRSLDYGDNWEFIGLEYEYISSLAINSNDEIFAGSRGHHYEGNGGILRSLDNGETWTELIENILVTSIAIDSEDKIFIGCSDLDGASAAVQFSDDNGESWHLIESEMMPVTIEIRSLTISENDYLYAISNESISHIYRSRQPTVGINDFSVHETTDIKLSNYPNPFNPLTTISFDLPVNVENPIIEIFNIKGKKIRQYSIINKQSSIVWDGTDNYRKPVSSGVYLYKIKSDESVLMSNKMLLLK
ncbi:MAG: T9SS type A sorting domain-containing protein [Candidatus Cloacimonetes bacterium]|nr:T9SS type A sorting domain-containing protein [Candidatus Cloacimonadota bacterium]